MTKTFYTRSVMQKKKKKKDGEPQPTANQPFSLYRNVGRYRKPLEISIKSPAWFHCGTSLHAPMAVFVCECHDTEASTTSITQR